MPEAKEAIYKPGDALKSGEKIEAILGINTRVGVFRCDTGGICWEYFPDEPEPAFFGKVCMRVDHLAYLINRSIPDQERGELRRRLAVTFFHALNASNESDAGSAFTPIESYVLTHIRVNRSLYFLVAAFLLLQATLASGYGFYDGSENLTTINAFVIGGVLGALGAFVSVLQRIGGVEFNDYAPLWFSSVQGAARVLLGIIFGIFMVFAIRTGFFNRSVGEDFYIIGVLTFVAGLSERFVPDIIQRIEKSSSKFTVR